EKGLTRGAVIAPIDMATMGLAGRFFRGTGLSQAAGRTLADLGLGSGGGATGEALAQIATEGRVNRPGDVLTEAAAEGPGGVVEGVTNVYGSTRRPQADVAPEVAPPVAAPSPAAPQTLADAVAPRTEPVPPAAAAVAPAPIVPPGLPPAAAEALANIGPQDAAAIVEALAPVRPAPVQVPEGTTVESVRQQIGQATTDAERRQLAAILGAL